MRCPRMTAVPGDLWVPRLLLGVGAYFDLVRTTQKVTTYEDHPREAYKWCTWTDVGSVCVVCIRFLL
jgi:hypothetical protein